MADTEERRQDNRGENNGNNSNMVMVSNWQLITLRVTRIKFPWLQ